jgi:hypothetical protein
VAPGAYDCEASRAGFAAQPPGRSETHSSCLSVASGQIVADLVLRLTPLGVISGRVLDPEGAPVSNANVIAGQVAYSAEGKRLAIRGGINSDDRGEFRLYGLVPGRYYIRVMPLMEGIEATISFGPAGAQRGYFQPLRNPVRGGAPPALAMTYYPNTPDVAQAAAVDVPAGGEARSIEIRVRRQARYSIRGTLPKGVNFPMDVERPLDDNFLPFEGVRQGDDSSFELAGLTPGSYVITGRQRDPSASGQFLYARVRVEVTDHDVEGLAFEFTPALKVSGILKAAGNSAVSLNSLAVTLRRIDDGKWIRNERANPDGTFTIGDIVPDRYLVALATCAAGPAETACPTGYITSVKLGDRELPDREIDLTRGTSEILAVTVSGEIGRIDGKVTADDGQPVPSAYVTLIPDQSKGDWHDRYLEANTDSAGRFVLDGVTPGRYTLYSWRDVPQGAPRDSDFRKPFENRGMVVEVEPNGRKSVELKVIDGGNTVNTGQR